MSSRVVNFHEENIRKYLFSIEWFSVCNRLKLTCIDLLSFKTDILRKFCNVIFREHKCVRNIIAYVSYQMLRFRYSFGYSKINYVSFRLVLNVFLQDKLISRFWNVFKFGGK